MKKLLVALLASAFTVLGAKYAQSADTITSTTIGPFKGLNTNQAPESIEASQSPDLLNVDIANGNTSVKKRQGYGLDTTLSVSTSPVHNLYKFFDSSGNEVRLAFNDFKVSSSVNGAAWSVILTTGLALGSTWDCTDYLGFAYCVSSSFDCPIKTNGTSAGTTGVCGTNAVPQGSLVANSGDRLLIGATSANPSRIYYSQSTVFTNFALGVQPSDSSYEDIPAPGSKLTHIAYRFGRWLWWKDQSFGFIVGTGQFDLNLVVVSNSIGTYDNTDVFDGNLVYFRGSDAQIYTYDGSTLSRAISTDIFPTLNLASRRKASSWTQTSQLDFQAGVSTPSVNISTTISPGDVTVSSFQAVENSSTQWTNGFSNGLTIGVSSISLSTNNSGNINDPSYESSTGVGPTYSFSSNWTVITNSAPTLWISRQTLSNGSGCTLAAQSGSYFAHASGQPYGNAVFQVILNNGSTGDSATILATKSITQTNDCTWTSYTLTDAADTGKRVRFQIKDPNSGVNNYIVTTESYIFGGSISFYGNASDNNAGHGPGGVGIDNITNGSSTITSGSFTSQAYNTGFASSTFQINQLIYTVNSSTPTFDLQTATALTGPWTEIVTSSGTNVISNKFVRFTSTISIGSGDSALTSISSWTILSRSTGSYFSAVNNAQSLTSWSTFGANDSTPGNSSITYYVRSATGAFAVGSSTVAWVQQTKNATVNYSTGTYFQTRADFAITAATETPTLSDFTFNWFEGTAADKMYGTYYSNAIWFSVSIGTTSTNNNRIFRYDLLSQVWTLYDIASNGFATYNNNLYFGDPSAGKIYRFGNNVYSDNGTAINAYWKSKPFFGDSPFTEKDLKTASWYIAEDSGTTLSMNYYLNETTTTVTKSINLYSATNNFIRSNYNFAAGTATGLFSAQFGDNSRNSPWEVFGGVVTFIPRPWVVTP